MKNLPLVLVLFFIISAFASCGSSPYKKRKGCKGKGGWYGKRNLGTIDHQKNMNQSTYYVLNNKEENVHN